MGFESPHIESGEAVSATRENLQTLLTLLDERRRNGYNEIMDNSSVDDLERLINTDNFLVSNPEEDISQLASILDAFGRMSDTGQIIDDTDSLRSMMEVLIEFNSNLSKMDTVSAEIKQKVAEFLEPRVALLDEKAAIIERYNSRR